MHIHFKVTWRVYVGRCKRMRGASFDASVYCIHFKVTWRVYVGRCKRMTGASFDASVCIYTSRWHDVSTSGVENAWKEHQILVYVYTLQGDMTCLHRVLKTHNRQWQEHHLMPVYVYCIHFKVTWRVYVGRWKRMIGAMFDASVCM